MTPDRTCATCRHALAIDSRVWPQATTHRHCALGHPMLNGRAVTSWLISAASSYRHRPVRWEAR